MMVVVAAIGIGLGASRLNQRDFLVAYGLSFLCMVGSSPILICYLWLRESPKQKASIPIEVLIARFAAVIVVGVILWATLVYLMAPID
jgi:hypothetical protein